MSQSRLSTAQQVLLDTSAYFAIADTTETRHSDADAIRRRLIAERSRLVTTNFIVAETHALFSIRLGYRFALRFLDDLDRSPTLVVRVTTTDEQRARQIIRQYDDKLFSYTDATSFAVMERLGISSVFTFDRNFTQYGLQALTP